MKLICVANESANIIYYGGDNTVTTSTGYPIKANEAEEFYIKAVENCPYFISSDTSDLRLIIWS
jgi:hypothetical protein